MQKIPPRNYKIFDPNAFILPPFSICPKCGDDEMGIMYSLGNSYTKKCKNCNFEITESLPEISKKVIYIDQSAISKMIDSIRPTSRSYEKEKSGRFRNLFEKLDRLVKLQLISCPRSNIHKEESAVMPDLYQDWKRMYEHISAGVILRLPIQIEKRQFLRVYRKWIGEDIAIISPEDAFDLSSLHRWADKIGISADIVFPGMREEIITKKEKYSNELTQLFKEWQKIESFSYPKFYRNEIIASGKIITSQYSEERNKLEKIFSEVSIEIDIDSNAMNIPKFSMLKEIFNYNKTIGCSSEESVKMCLDFFQSEILLDVPILQISGMMFSSIAQEASNIRKNVPSPGMLNDIRAISCYLPYVDAMFVDKECHALLGNVPKSTPAGKAKDNLNIKKKVFSLTNLQEFINYLDSIENSATQEHKDTVRMVYGDDWLKPYTGMYATEP